jgi:hypothetical protein
VDQIHFKSYKICVALKEPHNSVNVVTCLRAADRFFSDGGGLFLSTTSKPSLDSTVSYPVRKGTSPRAYRNLSAKLKSIYEFILSNSVQIYFNINEQFRDSVIIIYF